MCVCPVIPSYTTFQIVDLLILQSFLINPSNHTNSSGTTVLYTTFFSISHHLQFPNDSWCSKTWYPISQLANGCLFSPNFTRKSPFLTRCWPHPHPLLSSPILCPGFPQPHPTSAPKIQTLGGCTWRPTTKIGGKTCPSEIEATNFWKISVWNGLDMPQSWNPRHSLDLRWTLGVWPIKKGLSGPLNICVS